MFGRSISSGLLTLSLTLGTAALADADHGHAKGPHGGEVRTFAADFHLEAVRNAGKVSIFVLDGAGGKEASIEKHGGGSINVIAASGAPQKSEIKEGSPFSKVDVSVPVSGKVTVLVSLRVGDKATTAKFAFD